MLIKAEFSQRIAKNERRNRSRIATGERDIWQRRYWEHVIRDERDYARHVNYVHYNPMKHGYVERVSNRSHSTFHRLVARGIYPPDWAGVPESELEAGERVSVYVGVRSSLELTKLNNDE